MGRRSLLAGVVAVGIGRAGEKRGGRRKKKGSCCSTPETARLNFPKEKTAAVAAAALVVEKKGQSAACKWWLPLAALGVGPGGAYYSDREMGCAHRLIRKKGYCSNAAGMGTAGRTVMEESSTPPDWEVCSPPPGVIVSCRPWVFRASQPGRRNRESRGIP